MDACEPFWECCSHSARSAQFFTLTTTGTLVLGLFHKFLGSLGWKASLMLLIVSMC